MGASDMPPLPLPPFRALPEASYLRPVNLRVLLLIAAAALLFTLLPHEVAAQGCAMCKATVESSEEQTGVFGGQQAVGAGLNKGILLLMVVPYILLFLFFRKRLVGFFKEFAAAKG